MRIEITKYKTTYSLFVNEELIGDYKYWEAAWARGKLFLEAKYGP